ncbi:Short-chain dehydrogenase/reductase SDR [Penicillium atrosanguineum]|uniref:Short-chain dehydrogenase/reductase SDR n=1 Tax=Penicillium atrosanguineum TaxID=1132637 RepID=A0A9W9QFD3_9EURO|nr:Short-chain dehydrogenase/reductase SDR [Penicillium atrosanguineum]KAJ5147447.1 Short-chain dehydrogenase/reductase SDR [Penicillium atrosanguineum]KAJ5331243.1 Short-chain dehydrogenase/reductase SDR [Penicillium atrosanguineum]
MAQLQIDTQLLTEAANKTVLITGAARGIGAATARLFNQHGANVVIADLAQFRDVADQSIDQFEYPDRAIFVPGNIIDWAQLTACFKTAINRFGGIDIVVANAGIMESEPVLDLIPNENGDLEENEEAERVINVNLKGTLNSIPSLIPPIL